jgi:hypothetical protein
MDKCRVSFNLDLSKLLPGADPKAVKEFITRELAAAARAHHRERLNAMRANGKVPREVRDKAQRENLRSIRLSHLMEANLEVGPLPPGATVETYSSPR